MILHRYIGSESLKTTAAVTTTLLLIVLSSRFVRYLAEISKGDLSPDSLFLLILLRIPNFLELLLPLGFFIGLLLAFGRLYTDSEVTVMNACGLGPVSLLKFSALPIAVISLITASLSLYITPKSLKQYEALIKENKRATYSAVGGKFRLDTSSGRTTYIEEYSPDNMEMRGVFTSRPVRLDNGRILYTVINAEYGKLGQDTASGEQYLLLDNGYRIVGVPGSLDFQIARFSHYGQYIEDNPVNRLRNIKDGLDSIDLYRSDNPEHHAALQWRISLAFIVPIASIMAIGLSRTSPRSGRYAKLLPAILLYMAYLVMLNSAHAYAIEGNIFIGIQGIWYVHALAFLIACTILFWPDMTRRLSR